MCTTQHANQIVINYKVDITSYRNEPKNMSGGELEELNNRLYTLDKDICSMKDNQYR